MQKGNIKIEIGNYNSLSSLNYNSKVDSPSPVRVASPVPAPAMIKIETRIKEQQQTQRNNILYLGDHEDQFGNPTIQDQTKQEQEEISALYKDIIESTSWHCPCGEKIDGPIQFFQHVKTKHQYDTLQQLVQKKTLHRVIELYPPICKEEIDIIEELDAFSPLEVLKELADKKEKALKGKAPPPLVMGNTGTFGDMAYRFVEKLTVGSAQQSLMLHFFAFLKEYVQTQLGPRAWTQESPSELLRHSNQIFNFFLEKCEEGFEQLQEEDVKKLIYILAKWMFVNRWTGDRIFRAYEEQRENKEGLGVEKYIEGNVGNSEGNLAWKIEEG